MKETFRKGLDGDGRTLLEWILNKYYQYEKLG
jgi:hypothetical protein